jgi:hypothetical protein
LYQCHGAPPPSDELRSKQPRNLTANSTCAFAGLSSMLAHSSFARVLRSQARCGRRRAGLPPTPFGLPASAVAGFLPCHGFGEAKPKPCEGWRRGPDEALAKSDAPLAQAASSFNSLEDRSNLFRLILSRYDSS